MPVICVLDNGSIKIYIYNFDHPKPHVHIVKCGKTSSKGVDMLFDGTFPHGSDGLSASDIKIVREWIAEHLEKVSEDWGSAERGNLSDTRPRKSEDGNTTPVNEAIDSDTDDNAIYITNATPLPGKRLLCKYNDGKWNLFDVRPLLGNDVFSPLESDDTFYNIDISKGAPSWDDERIDIAPEHLHENGMPLDDRDAWFLEFVSSLDDSGKDGAKRDLLSAVIDGFIEYVSVRQK